MARYTADNSTYLCAGELSFACERTVIKAAVLRIVNTHRFTISCLVLCRDAEVTFEKELSYSYF